MPRLPSDTATIKATLKRRLRYKHHVYCLNIRPEAVREAAKFLSTTPLYKEHGISFDESWQCESEEHEQNIEINIHSNIAQSQSSSEDHIAPVPLHADSSSGESAQIAVSHEDAREDTNGSVEDGFSDDDDKWSEVDSYESMCGEADTLLTAPSFIDQSEMEHVYNYAPGEGSLPISIFLEKDSEELAFPAIFCGRRRPSNTERPVRVTYGEIVKSELRNADRRAARSVENLFFKTKKIQMKSLIDQTQIALRKVKISNKNLSAKDVKGDAALDLIHHDKAYKFLASIRGSPPYFERISKDLFAFIRNLGTATFFLTLSAAETKWNHLLKILSQVVDNKVLSDDEVSQLTWPQKCRLIQSDPITCARHFDFSVQKFLNKFLLTKANPLFEITDYFYRVEYQQRGSPHIHMLLWCKNAPKNGENSESEVCDFIDEYITCKKPNEDESIFDLVQVQKHKHSHTCKKRNKKICRFNFPRPPMKATTILEPLKQPEVSEEELTKHKQSWMKIHEYLQSLDENDGTITHEVLLSSLRMTEEEYVSAIRSSIKATTVFLKRSPQEIRINNYNKATLEAWRANIDVQFVLDVYACATYVASYVTKAQRGMSELLRKATEEARQGNQSLKQQVRCVGNKFLNAVELSAQEAAYICLQLPMRRASRQCMFINTSPPEGRVTLLKPAKILESLNDEDEDIECSNILKRYEDRPQELENISLAEFCAWYSMEEAKKKTCSRGSSRTKTVDNLLPEPANVENEDEEIIEEEQIANNTAEAAKYRRKLPRILRTVHFNPEKDSEKYYRELIMLYSPWRDEQNLIGNSNSFQCRFNELEAMISPEMEKYEPYSNIVNLAQEALAIMDDGTEAWDCLAPVTQHEDEIERSLRPPEKDLGIEDGDIAREFGLPVTDVENELIKYNELPDEEYRKHMRFVNEEQLEFLYDTMYKLKTSSTPIYRFMSGVAGVGKSFLTKAIY